MTGAFVDLTLYATGTTGAATQPGDLAPIRRA
jgi:hypothetical protein